MERSFRCFIQSIYKCHSRTKFRLNNIGLFKTTATQQPTGILRASPYSTYYYKRSQYLFLKKFNFSCLMQLSVLYYISLVTARVNKSLTTVYITLLVKSKPRRFLILLNKTCSTCVEEYFKCSIVFFI